jgi:hypothetical protein
VASGPKVSIALSDRPVTLLVGGMARSGVTVRTLTQL